MSVIYVGAGGADVGSPHVGAGGLIDRAKDLFNSFFKVNYCSERQAEIDKLKDSPAKTQAARLLDAGTKLRVKFEETLKKLDTMKENTKFRRGQGMAPLYTNKDLANKSLLFEQVNKDMQALHDSLKAAIASGKKSGAAVPEPKLVSPQ